MGRGQCSRAQDLLSSFSACSLSSCIYIYNLHFQHPALTLSHSAVTLATQGLTHTRLGNQISIWGNAERVWGKLFKAEDPLPAQLASAPVRSRGAVSLPFSACCAYPALPTGPAGSRGWGSSQQAACPARVPPASSNSFPCPEESVAVRHFYTLCLAARSPSQTRGFSTLGYLCAGSWESGASAGRNLLVSGLN